MRYARQANDKEEESNEIFKAYGIRNRSPVPAEFEYMHRLIEEYGLPVEIIAIACERTILQTGKAQFAYTDSILRSWSKNGVKTVEDVREQERRYYEKASETSRKTSYDRRQGHNAEHDVGAIPSPIDSGCLMEEGAAFVMLFRSSSSQAKQ